MDDWIGFIGACICGFGMSAVTLGLLGYFAYSSGAITGAICIWIVAIIVGTIATLALMNGDSSYG